MFWTFSLLAQTQYDYYDDGVASGGADRTLNAIIVFLFFVFGAIAIAILGGLFFKIYNFINPKDNSKKSRENLRQTKTIENPSSSQVRPSTALDVPFFSVWDYSAYKKTFELTIKPQNEDVMIMLYSYKMYDGYKLVSAAYGAGTTRRKYDINPREGTKIICDFAYDDYERRFETAVINIPNSVIAIGKNAFTYLDLRGITIPPSVKYITGNPFGRRCDTVICNTRRFSCDDGYLLSQEQSLLIADLSVNQKVRRTPKGIKYIGRGVYQLQNDLQILKIDSSVVAIAENGVSIKYLRAIVFEGIIQVMESSLGPNVRAIYVPKGAISYYEDLLHPKYHEYLLEIENNSDEEILRKIAMSEDKQNQSYSLINQAVQPVAITKKEIAYINNEIMDYSLSSYTEEERSNKVIDWGVCEDDEHEPNDEGLAIYTADGNKLIELCCDEDYKIKKGTKIICDGAFAIASSDITISFPSSVKVFGNYLYDYVEKDKFIIPKSIQKITGNPFATCNGMIECKSPFFIYERGVLYDQNKLKVISVMWDWQDTDVEIDPNVIMIGRFAFYKKFLGDTIMVIPPNTRYIGEYAFYGSYMKDYILSSKLVEIGEHAFFGSNIKKVTLPYSLTIMGKGTFACCDGLECVTLSPNLEVLESEAFYHCEKLQKIIIPEGIKIIKSECFLFCGSLEMVYLPNSLLKIEKDAFVGTKLQSVVASKNTIVENGAFPSNCAIYYRE